MRHAVLPVSLVVGLPCLLGAAQQPPVRTVTTGVVVDVTVVDGKGNPILDLKAGEFELSEDGVRQRIVSATLIQRGVLTPLTSGTAASVADAPAPEPAAAAAGSSSAAAVTPSVTAILFDRLSPESRGLARRAALTYVATLTPPHDYAGVFLADLSLRTFQPFTNQAENLARAIERVAGTAPANTQAQAELESKRVYGLDPSLSPTQGTESAGGGFDSIPEREHRLNDIRARSSPSEWIMQQIELRMREGYQRFLAEFDGEASLAGLRAAVNALGELPGRKSILYFTEKLPIPDRQKPEFDALIGEANRANITFYPVDAVGLRVHSEEAKLSRDVDVAGAKGIGDESRGEGAWTKDLEKQSELLSSRPSGAGPAGQRHGRLPPRKHQRSRRRRGADATGSDDLLPAHVSTDEHETGRHVPQSQREGETAEDDRPCEARICGASAVSGW
jgi:VWFA-related protein